MQSLIQVCVCVSVCVSDRLLLKVTKDLKGLQLFAFFFLCGTSLVLCSLQGFLHLHDDLQTCVAVEPLCCNFKGGKLCQRERASSACEESLRQKEDRTGLQLLRLLGHWIRHVGHLRGQRGTGT